MTIGELIGDGFVTDPLAAGAAFGAGEGIPGDVAAQPQRIVIAATQGRRRMWMER
jgi:hypothetical protein